LPSRPTTVDIFELLCHPLVGGDDSLKASAIFPSIPELVARHRTRIRDLHGCSA